MKIYAAILVNCMLIMASFLYKCDINLVMGYFIISINHDTV